MALLGFRDIGHLAAGDNPNTLTLLPGVGQTAGAMIDTSGDILWLWDNPATTWNSFNLTALSAATLDGNNYVITRGNTTTGVAPTNGEAPTVGLTNGDTANIYLSNGQMEYWVYNGTVWAVAFTITAQQLSNALVTLSGVASAATDLGTFTGTTIADNLTIKAALQALETALEAAARSVTDTNTIDLTLSGAGALSANLRIDATQDANYTVTQSATGVRITENAPAGPFNSFALAAADASVIAGRRFFLSANNLEFVFSTGTATGPLYNI